MFYSAKTGGFYSTEINGESIPKDAVEISDDEHSALLQGQSEGKVIKADAGGNPFLADRPAPTDEELDAAKNLARATAYRNESDPLFFKEQRGEAPEGSWLAKVEEIKARHPK